MQYNESRSKSQATARTTLTLTQPARFAFLLLPLPLLLPPPLLHLLHDAGEAVQAHSVGTHQREHLQVALEEGVTGWIGAGDFGTLPAPKRPPCWLLLSHLGEIWIVKNAS